MRDLNSELMCLQQEHILNLSVLRFYFIYIKYIMPSNFSRIYEYFRPFVATAFTFNRVGRFVGWLGFNGTFST